MITISLCRNFVYNGQEGWLLILFLLILDMTQIPLNCAQISKTHPHLAAVIMMTTPILLNINLITCYYY